MDVSREAFRALMFYDYKWGRNIKESQENLKAGFGESAPALATITYCFREFKRGRVKLNDDPRPGRPPTAVTHENVIRVDLHLWAYLTLHLCAYLGGPRGMFCKTVNNLFCILPIFYFTSYFWNSPRIWLLANGDNRLIFILLFSNNLTLILTL